MAAKVNKEECIGRGRCEEVCPVGVIRLGNDKATIHDDCIECGACVGEFPIEAIAYNF